ncbi:MAG: 4-amino-4-deoxychorismate lyase [Bacteroidetes bacterium CG_4_9_14_3_um_filter_41_19]|nr:MAG: 4-amino-4-deoxychorismate lyase [Bacteroidetes bacterium CG_4_9_14_3_um_filter_41_19]
MCRLLETIRMENRQVENLVAHQFRMDQSCLHFFGQPSGINLQDLVDESIQNPNQSNLNNGIFKMRVVYSQQLEEVTFMPYTLPEIQSLKLVIDDEIDYAHKFADRQKLEQLMLKKEACDDIVIIKNGLFTDTSYANLAFFDGIHWFTPDQPLLKGTRRSLLLLQKKILPTQIRLAHLRFFTKARLFNAMIRWEDRLDVSIDKIWV